MDELEKTIKKLSNLTQYKNKTSEELKLLAEEELRKKEIISSTMCVDDDEIKFADNLLKKYLSQGTIESESDKEMLRQLIDQELIAERFKHLLKTQYSASNPAQDMDMVEQLDKVVERITKLKKDLGLANKDDVQNSWLGFWNKLEKKCINYYKEHAAETYTKCPRCQHIYRLILRIDNKEKVSATFFKGTKVYNKKLFSLYHEKRLTEIEIAEILGVSVQYIQYIYDEVFLPERKGEAC